MDIGQMIFSAQKQEVPYDYKYKLLPSFIIFRTCSLRSMGEAQSPSFSRTDRQTKQIPKM